ncbi:MAG: hypothetical protein E6I73_05545 [Chloroflexi bacterium]|nr:MAG: hypothetical protein E6I73_05545 [Chloroflexota bacterium]
MKLVAAAAALLVVSSLAACGGNPPQIVDYSPERGNIGVSTAAPIRITFDHNVDKASVETRLSLFPATSGNVVWLSPRRLEYEHPTLLTSTTYEVVLQAGYRDLAGNAYALRHHWAFTTEGAPTIAASAPADKENEVDPASYISIDFSRDMDVSSLAGAITIGPVVPFTVRLDPTDGRRAVVVPGSLLNPATLYTVWISTGALDSHGNQLNRPASFAFNTGPVRPLHHWVSFATALADGTSGGVWIVNESGLPRRLYDSQSVRSFSWSPEGTSLLIQTGAASWSSFTPGTASKALPFNGVWAAPLEAGRGYIYIDAGGVLHRWLDGADEEIARNVSQAATAPNGQRVAFVQLAGATSTVWGYDVGLRSRYQLASENGIVTDLSWSLAGNRIAYLRNDAGSIALRVRNLTGQASTTTVATGDIGRPTWLPDSTHVVFAAGITTPAGTTRKAFLVNVIAPPTALTAALALPSNQSADVSNPVPSPDGHQIAFVSENQVWIMNADGTRPVALTRFDASSFPYSCVMPTWTRV